MEVLALIALIALAVVVVAAPIAVCYLTDPVAADRRRERKASRRSRKEAARAPRVETFDSFTRVSYPGAPSVTVMHHVEASDPDVDYLLRYEQRLTARSRDLDFREQKLLVRARELAEANQRQATREQQLDSRQRGLDRRLRVLAEAEDNLRMREEKHTVKNPRPTIVKDAWYETLNYAGPPTVAGPPLPGHRCSPACPFWKGPRR